MRRYPPDLPRCNLSTVQSAEQASSETCSDRRFTQTMRKSIPIVINGYNNLDQALSDPSRLVGNGGQLRARSNLAVPSALANGSVNCDPTEVSVNFGSFGTMIPATGFSKSAPDG